MHFVHDFGSTVDGDPVFQADHVSLKVDPANYPYTLYHLTFASLGSNILNSLDVSFRHFCPGVSNPTGLQVRSVPFDIDLLAPSTSSTIPDEEKLPLPALNWQF